MAIRDQLTEFCQAEAGLLLQVVETGLGCRQRAFAVAASVEDVVAAQVALDIACQQEGILTQRAQRIGADITPPSRLPCCFK